jgi:two-component system, NtrC family, response regulator AtoC
MSKINILIADDEPDLRNYLIHVLKENFNENINFTEAVNGQEAFELAQTKSFDLILLDVKMPVMDGLQALSKILKLETNSFIVMITAHANVRDAVLAIKDGAYDYIEKPLKKEKLLEILNKAIEAKKLVEQISLSFPILENDIESDIIGHSKSMIEVFNLIKKISSVDSTILLRGENGTGKELVAKAIHFNSNRKSDPLITVNCAAIPDGLIESELFGHEKGAFTDASERKIGKFQLANNGTLFLDEIGELKLEVQSKLLRVLQEKTFMPVGSNRVQKSNARIIAATNQNLEKLISDGLFREDLYFRLNVIPVYIPSLKERIDDLPSLLEHFLIKYSNESTFKNYFSNEALEKLKNYTWPGNIRELENTVQRAIILSTQAQINADDLPQQIQAFEIKKNEDDNFDFEKFKYKSEKTFIEKALIANDGKINQTVANANIPKNTLLRKIKKFNIDLKKLTK